MTLRHAQGRRLAGYAAIFDAPDRGGDIVRKGAFARAAKAGIPLLWQHDTSRRIGFVESLSKDERGLRVVARMDGEEPAGPVLWLPRCRMMWARGYRRAQPAISALRFVCMVVARWAVLIV
jgi:Caudovirus prohead serine protease